MAETRQEARMYIVDYQCDECGNGQMRSDGTSLTVYPLLYPHTCNNCGAKKNLEDFYPTNRFEPKEPITVEVNLIRKASQVRQTASL